MYFPVSSLWASANVVPSDFQKACWISKIYAQNEIHDMYKHEPFNYFFKISSFVYKCFTSLGRVIRGSSFLSSLTQLSSSSTLKVVVSFFPSAHLSLTMDVRFGNSLKKEICRMPNHTSLFNCFSCENGHNKYF